MIFRTLFFAALLMLTACDGGSNTAQTDANSQANPSWQSKLQGVWEQTGYGELVVVEQAQATQYQFTSSTCVRLETSALDDISNITFAENDNAFEIREAELGFAEYFRRIDELPDVCLRPVGESPVDIFEHVWRTFNERYAFFSERNVNWMHQYDAVRDQISEHMPDNDLFIALATLLLAIDDAHVSLTAGEEAHFSPAQPKGVLKQLIDEFDNQHQFSDLDQYFDHALSQWTEILVDNYLDEPFFAAGGQGNDMLLWGTIGTDIGYLRVDRMVVSEQTDDVQIDELNEILDEVFLHMLNTTGMIVDVRINQGGTDAIALQIANRFADSQRMAVRKFARSASGDNPAQEILFQPTAAAYLQPIVLITSGTTTSAAEVFTVSMRELPHVTHMGEPTNGSLSDALEKTLPNGWQFSLANEVYSGSDGVAHEATGIRPDIEIPVFHHALRQAGQDSALNAALEFLHGNR